MPLTQLVGPTIAINTSLSPPLNVAAGHIFRILTPAEWTPAPLTFQISYDGTNYYNAFDKNCKEVVLPITVDTCIVFGAYFQEITSIKFRSGTQRQPVVQLAERVFGVILSSKPDNSLPAGYM